MITEYEKLCALCGAPAECRHHLIYGSRRALADKDGLLLPLCNDCHNLAISPQERIHGNPVAEKLSKIIGQLQWESEHVDHEKARKDPGKAAGEVRERFRKRYGRSYL